MPIAILGMGKTGISLARYFSLTGETVWAIDDKRVSELSDEAFQYAKEFFSGGVLPDFSKIERFFISPGIDPKHPAAQAALEKGLILEGELDLASGLCQGEVLAVTGTNGKSTTVSLLGEILRVAGRRVGVGGNLGTPFLDLVLSPENYNSFVVEISSYQLETARRFRPHVAALLNISDDHLDRYASFKDYALAKAKIFANQKPDDTAVYNDDDVHVLEALEVSAKVARRLPFSITKSLAGVYASTEKEICWAPQGEPLSRFDLSKSRLKGLHNLENICCAVACAKAVNIADTAIQKAIDEFRGLPHRIEWVAEINGVHYYDDSKATNVGAVVMSLASFDQGVILILGGRDKGGEYLPLRAMVKNKVKALIVMGEATEKIVQAFETCTEIVRVHSMEEAVSQAQALASSGDTVLLSPACSSFDMFKDYHDRGEQFKKYVLAKTSSSL